MRYRETQSLCQLQIVLQIFVLCDSPFKSIVCCISKQQTYYVNWYFLVLINLANYMGLVARGLTQEEVKVKKKLL